MHRHRALRLRYADPAETGRILAYYEMNPSEFILARTRQQIAEAADHRMMVLLEYEGHMVGVSAMFDLENDADGGVSSDSMTLEVGGTHIHRHFEGYGLQRILFAVRSAMALHGYGPEVSLATVINPQNDKSLHNTRAAGFVRWDTPTEALLSECAKCTKEKLPGSRCCSNYFILPREVQTKQVAQMLAESYGTNLLTRQNRRNNADMVTVSLSFGFLTGSRREALEEICGLRHFS